MTAPIESCDPIAVLVLRGGRVESRHRAAFAVTDAAGVLTHGRGEVREPIFPRSAVKPLQALALLESGAADRFGVSPVELALACASHGGEPAHVGVVQAWLERLGLGPDALECGAHAPSHAASAERLSRSRRAPSPLHNNCSGKHAGMLTLALHLEVAPAGYTRPDHPVQRRIAGVLAEMAGVAALDAPAVDGCSAPTFPLSLVQLASAMARLGSPRDLRPERAVACERVRAAMRAHPYMVAGAGRACTAIMSAAPEILVKTGAEGVYAAALPAQGLGVALKVEDGAGRASVVALLALLEALGALDARTRGVLAELARPVLRNHRGLEVGRLEPAPGWAELGALGALSRRPR
ncbi:MAG: asparaginase [Geminicoccaceae bacterium]